MLFVSLLQFGIQMLSVMFVGRLGELHLASSSLTTSIAGVTGYTVMIGMGSALETLCGQAYGAKQYAMLGVHAQRAMLVFGILSIPISVLWIFTGPILGVLKQDPEISAMAGESAPWLIPSILPFGILQSQTRFLQTQGITVPQMATTAVGCLVHGVVCWVLVDKLKMGNSGACLANGVTYWVIVIVLAGYIKVSSSCQETWKSFSLEGARGVLSFLKLGVPSAFMMCLEFWSFQVFIVLAGLLPDAELETSMMLIRFVISITGYIFNIYTCFKRSTRISNELGAGNPGAARMAVRVVLLLAVSQGLLASSIATATRHVWGCIYTDDKILITYLSVVAPKIAVCNFIDGIHGVLSGCVRGCGWQNCGAYISLGAYYFVGIPVALLFAFVWRYGGEVSL
ncbi:unnamed protein product [Linum tenue]|uniref:Multidrug and toxic compound extrusion protein n=1 Tax=Linum tenue TaxID=586396 RepID=A0AAV0MX84_9ROSI|nr:unnamed protein product [Linum tenue]